MAYIEFICFGVVYSSTRISTYYYIHSQNVVDIRRGPPNGRPFETTLHFFFNLIMKTFLVPDICVRVCGRVSV